MGGGKTRRTTPPPVMRRVRAQWCLGSAHETFNGAIHTIRPIHPVGGHAPWGVAGKGIVA